PVAGERRQATELGPASPEAPPARRRIAPGELVDRRDDQRVPHPTQRDDGSVQGRQGGEILRYAGLGLARLQEGKARTRAYPEAVRGRQQRGYGLIERAHAGHAVVRADDRQAARGADPHAARRWGRSETQHVFGGESAAQVEAATAARLGIDLQDSAVGCQPQELARSEEPPD